MALAVGLGLFLVLYGNLTALVRIRPPVRVALNLAVGALVVAAGRAAGLSLERMGLAAGDLAIGVSWGAGVGAALALALGAALATTRGAPLFRDVRLSRLGRGELAFRLLVQIPLGIALFEEVAFRGVVLGALTRVVSDPAAVAISSAAFGLWHIGPALDRLRANRPGAGRRAALTHVAGTVLVTAVGGVLFAALRLRAGSIAAPILAHAAANVLGVVGARRAAQETPASRSISARSSGPG